MALRGLRNGKHPTPRGAGCSREKSSSIAAEGTRRGSGTTSATGLRTRQNRSRTGAVLALGDGAGGIHGRKRRLVGKKAVRCAEKRQSGRFGHTKLFRVIYQLLTTTGCGWPNQKAQHMGFPEKRVNRFLDAEMGKIRCSPVTRRLPRAEGQKSPLKTIRTPPSPPAASAPRNGASACRDPASQQAAAWPRDRTRDRAAPELTGSVIRLRWRPAQRLRDRRFRTAPSASETRRQNATVAARAAIAGRTAHRADLQPVTGDSAMPPLHGGSRDKKSGAGPEPAAAKGETPRRPQA